MQSAFVSLVFFIRGGGSMLIRLVFMRDPVVIMEFRGVYVRSCDDELS